MPRAKDLADNLPEVDWSRFEGIAAPAYTQTPDEVFDWIMAYLKGAELKVLLYIVRRTFGFKKAADAISIDQLCNGIVRRDGRRLDLGTGLKRPTVLTALRSLREKNLIVSLQQYDAASGSRPTVYALNMRAGDGARAPLRLSRDEQTGEYRSGDPGVHQNIPPGMPLKTPGALPQDGGVDRAVPREYAAGDPQETDDQETENQQTETSKTSKATPIEKKDGDGGRLYSTYISQVIADFSKLLHDGAHERSNRTRAMRLWAASGLDEETFVDILQEARAIAQARPVEREAADGSPEGTKNRMPYYFRVVEDLVDMAVAG
jgi:hypothetical protein